MLVSLSIATRDDRKARSNFFGWRRARIGRDHRATVRQVHPDRGARCCAAALAPSLARCAAARQDIGGGHSFERPRYPARDVLAEQALDDEDVLNCGAWSEPTVEVAFVNDQPVSVALCAAWADTLVEIQARWSSTVF